jgi:uncharacterized membrane protein
MAVLSPVVCCGDDAWKLWRLGGGHDSAAATAIAGLGAPCHRTTDMQIQSQTLSRTLSHLAYLVTILFKGFVGFLEFTGGAIIALSGPQRLYSFVLSYPVPELYDRGHDHAARLISQGAALLAQSQTTFIIIYLLVHGILKMAITTVLLRGRGEWVFPFASTILAGFIAYMSYELIDEWSNWILALALFDTFTLSLVLNEWRNWHRASRR